MSKRRHNLIRERFGRLSVIDFGRNNAGRTAYKCLCDCGKEVVIETSKLRLCTRSCGCLSRVKNGLSASPTGKAYQAMMERCYKIGSHNYHLYGERGITVCDRWRDSILNFVEDMGKKPKKGLSLDRIDVNGNYCKENCRWATDKQQQRNRRSNRKLTAFGKTQIITQWSEETGISVPTIRTRLSLGWSLEETLTFKDDGRVKIVCAFGKSMSISDWSRETGIKICTLWKRLKKGWTPEEALTKKVKVYGKEKDN